MGPQAAKEEIRERIDLVDFIGQYVQLKPAGRNWKGLCPFHQENTPSFNVNRETKFWKCFGCGAAGDIFTFVERIENVSFMEALRLLGDRLGIKWETGRWQSESRDEREQILRINAIAAEWFRAQLRAPVGAAARAYLESRGVDEATIERFHLGFAPPGWEGLLTYLNSRSISGERALRAGLVRRHEERGTLYDVFRNRIIFPIADVVGRVIGFGARALDPEEPAKYLNSPETIVFKKGQTFYGLDAARVAIANEGFAVVVEGYMDVIALAQHGIANCLATLGTALTEQHAKVLARYTPEICLVFDADAAGMQAALRSIRVFERCPVTVRVAVLRDGKDPDDYIREFGAAAFRELLEERIELVEYRVKSVFARYAEEGAEGRKKAAREVADILEEVPDIARRQALIAWAADAWAGPDIERAARLEEALIQELHRRARNKAPKERDAWEKWLVKQGLPAAQAWQQSRRLARAEWLEQERQRQQLLMDVLVARCAGISPDSEYSFANSDFITDTLAKSSHPVLSAAHRCERRMLAAILREPGMAAQVFGRLSPAEFRVPIHREIAEAICELINAGETPVVSAVAERLSQNDELVAAVADVAVSEDDYDCSQVELDVMFLREAKVLGTRGIRLYRGEKQPLEPLIEGETLADLEKRVHDLMRSGDGSPEHPAYQRMMEIRKKLHGRGGRDYWDYH